MSGVAKISLVALSLLAAWHLHPLAMAALAATLLAWQFKQGRAVITWLLAAALCFTVVPVAMAIMAVIWHFSKLADAIYSLQFEIDELIGS